MFIVDDIVIVVISGLFTVMCYNVLCDKYATRAQYGYCPSWALNWDYRKKGILEEIRRGGADILALQVSLYHGVIILTLLLDLYNGLFCKGIKCIKYLIKTKYIEIDVLNLKIYFQE